MVGKSFWVAHRLAALAALHWAEVDGQAAKDGIDPLFFPVHRWLNYVYFIFVRSMDEEKRAQFDIMLDTPPVLARGRTVSESAAEAEGDGFMAFMGAAG